ncbi:MAG: tRNA (N(6)-L-threonylcarbamoyladenosine(37)-C(2))-methylthiotransferase MtaB [Clostridiales bacterium]|nr:tRNA (N(6)-L-threonylcarbamoyladenosine(37)-C(2))-methylthiotransferase MtaB [Clostridiales bacterium]
MVKWMYKCAVTSLGCKVNQCEAEAIKTQMKDMGYEICDFSKKADVYIINTCSVTKEGERKSRQMVRRAQGLNENAKICVTGCACQKEPEIFKNIEGVKIVCGNSKKHLLPKMIKEELSGIFVEDMAKYDCYDEMPDSAIEKTRAFIKVQDGCNNFCSYCIIPYLRGRERSRKIENIIKESTKLRDMGFKEIVINGIHLSSYGKEWDFKPSLKDVVKEICNISGIERVRLGSLEPRVITDEFLKVLSENKEFCPNFHLSLQSGCDTVLKRMNRKYSTEEYFLAVKRIRGVFPSASISTDIITGFPGETDEEFNKTLDFVNKVGFAWVHVFPYSKREGTVAEKIPDQVIKQTKILRAHKLSELTDKIGKEYREQFVGKIKGVLCETNENGVQTGLIKEHIQVCFKSVPIENEIIKVKITKVTEKGLWGERID